MSEIPSVILNNGVSMPVFGLGTFQGPPGQEDQVKQAVKDAIDLGYRLLDCAHVYCNEHYIGEAIKEKIKEGIVKREDLFVISKLWCNAHSPDLVEPALKVSLKNLQLEYVDLYLIHWPQALKEGDDLHPKEESTGKFLLSDVDYVDTWKAMEDIYNKRFAKAIGVSNFNSKQIERLLRRGSIIPMVNQIECHPYLNQKKLRLFCQEKGIQIIAYSPLGAPHRPYIKDQVVDVLHDPKTKEIADRYGKTPAQVLIRYNLQLGNIVIPKSANQKRLKENIDVFDFSLAPEDMVYISRFECNGRTCPFFGTEHSPFYPYSPDVEF